MKFLTIVLLPVATLGQLLQPGGISDTTVSATDEPVVFAVQAINEHLARTSGDPNAPLLDLVEILSAKSQIVAGEKLYLVLHLKEDFYCSVSVWYRAWLQGSERLQVTDGPTCSHQAPSAPSVRSVLAGGISDRIPLDSSTDDFIFKALKSAACDVNDQSNNMYATILGDTSGITYTQQVTAGMTYHFYNVLLIESQCRNRGCANLDLTACPSREGGMKQICEFVVQSQLWSSNPFTLTKVTC